MTPVVASANVSTTTLFTVPAAGYYTISVCLSAITAAALVTAIVSIAYTEMGVAKTQTISLPLAVVTNAVSDFLTIYADVGTTVTYAVTGLSTGSLRLHIGWKPQGS